MKTIEINGKELSVSEYGDIYYNGVKKNVYDNGMGYKTVGVGRKQVYVHRIVCEAYNGRPSAPRLQVNHLNGIKSDNRPENLKWETSSDNHKHAYKVLGRVHSRCQSLRKGYDHHRGHPVDQICNITGVVLQTFGSLGEAAKALGLNSSNISSAARKYRGSTTCGGFRWEYNSKGNIYKSKYIYEWHDGVKKRIKRDVIK